MVTPLEVAFLVGRVLFGGFFIYNGINHFRNRKAMAGYAASKGVPAPGALVPLTGTLLLLGGTAVLLGIYPLVGLALIVLFLVGVTPKMHAFWTIDDAGARAAEQVNFSKNVALLGAALALMIVPRPWPLGVAFGL